MKKALALAMALTLMLFTAGCTATEDTVENKESSTPSPSVSVSSAPSQTPDVSASNTPSQTPDASAPIEQQTDADGFEQFKAALDEAGYSYETTQMAAEMVGAEVGEKFTFDFGKVELYRFADGAEPLTTGEIVLEGFGAFSISVNGNYGAIIDVTENEAEITAIFDGLK